MAVAKEIELVDRFENLGVQMVGEVASKTNDIEASGPRRMPPFRLTTARTPRPKRREVFRSEDAIVRH